MRTVVLAMILGICACEEAPFASRPPVAHAPPVVVAPAPAPAPVVQDAEAEGRAATELLFRGGDLWSRLDPQAKGLFGDDPQKLDAFRAKVLELGAETDVVSEKVATDDGVRVYRRVAHFANAGQPFEILFGFDHDARIVALAVRPTGKPVAAPSTKLDYETRNAYRLPFDGAWSVVWGGRTVEQNYHATVREQRFAYDLLVVKDDATHRGDGKKNEDYYAYGRPILAAAAGRVVAVVDGIAENVPGVMPTDKPEGNHVVVDHGNGELALYAHLVPGSIPVRVGTTLKRGQLLGKCGNSGHSSEPHLHWHLVNAEGEGLPPRFVDYLADGKPVAKGEPVQGQLLAPRK